MNIIIEQIFLAYQEGNDTKFFDLLYALRVLYTTEPQRYSASNVRSPKTLAEFLCDAYTGAPEDDDLIDETLTWLEA